MDCAASNSTACDIILIPFPLRMKVRLVHYCIAASATAASLSLSLTAASPLRRRGHEGAKQPIKRNDSVTIITVVMGVVEEMEVDPRRGRAETIVGDPLHNDITKEKHVCEGSAGYTECRSRE